MWIWRIEELLNGREVREVFWKKEGFGLCYRVRSKSRLKGLNTELGLRKF